MVIIRAGPAAPGRAMRLGVYVTRAQAPGHGRCSMRAQVTGDAACGPIGGSEGTLQWGTGAAYWNECRCNSSRHLAALTCPTHQIGSQMAVQPKPRPHLAPNLRTLTLTLIPLDRFPNGRPGLRRPATPCFVTEHYQLLGINHFQLSTQSDLLLIMTLIIGSNHDVIHRICC